MAMTECGVAAVVFWKTSDMTTASESKRYTMRQILLLSEMRSSWQRSPIRGIGREQGKDRLSPCCSNRSR